jgi:hypothetical protein
VAGLSENVVRQEDPRGFDANIHASVDSHTFVDPLPTEKLMNLVAPRSPASLSKSDLPSQHLH